MKIIFCLLLVTLLIMSPVTQSEPMLPVGGAKSIDDLMFHQSKPTPLVSVLKGKINLVYFGFAGCSKACPIALSALDYIYKEVNSDKLVVAFFNIDPSLDQKFTEQYVAQFNLKFKVLTGTQKQIDKAAERFYALFWPDSKTTYQHSDQIAVVNDKGEIEALYQTNDIQSLKSFIQTRI